MILKRGSPLLLLMVFVSSLGLFVTPARSGAEHYGKRVGAIRFSVDSPFEISFIELVNLLTISPGEVITPANIKSSISSLNEKGIFKRISVYGEEKDELVDLVFVLEPHVPVDSIKVRKAKYFTEKEITSKLRLRRGMPVDSIDVDELRNRIHDMYREDGYFFATSEVKVACHMDEGTGEVLINVFEGKKPQLGEIDIRGNDHFTDQEFIDNLGLVQGQTIERKTITKKLRNLEEKYKRRGFFLARISDPVIVDSPRGAKLQISVDEGDRFSVIFAGNTKYGKERLMAESGVYSDIVNTRAEIEEALRDGITSFYTEKGYPFVTVHVETGGEGNVISVRIEEGNRGLIGKISFSGNSNLQDKELRGVMDTATRGTFSFFTGKGILYEEVLENDLENVRGYYQSKGFPNATLEIGKLEFGKSGKLELEIKIEEGNQYKVRDIALRGVAFFADREIMKLVKNRAGEPIDYVAAYADAWVIQKKYFDEGFDDCKVSVSFQTKEERSEIDIFYTVQEGERFVLGKVLVTGNSHVASDVVLRELPVKRGEVLGESELITFQQRLYRTGVFRSVKIRKIKNVVNRELNLLIEVEEADALVLEGGAGYGTETGYRGSAGVTHKNINGFGRRIRGDLVISEKEFKFIIDLREPWFLGINVVGGLNFTVQETEEVSFTFEQISLGGSLTKEFWERSSLSLELTFSRENNKDVAPDAILSPEDVGSKSFLLLRPIFVLDLRDDPFNPRKGTFHSLFGEFSPGFFPSEVPYYKVTAQTAGYLNLGEKAVLALSGRGGYAETVGGGQVPIDKRFFLGGSTTVRGFKLDRLGPIGDDGSPIGGDTMVNVNAELRYYIIGNFVLALFLEGGSVWLRDIPEFGFDFRETAGYSIKYLTPAGFVSFDHGFKLDRREGESRSVVYFTIGTTF